MIQSKIRLLRSFEHLRFRPRLAYPRKCEIHHCDLLASHDLHPKENFDVPIDELVALMSKSDPTEEDTLRIGKLLNGE